jgi:hypothetical protein
MSIKSYISFALAAIFWLVISDIGHSEPLEEISPGSNMVAIISGDHLQAIITAYKNFCSSLNSKSLNNEKKECEEKDLFDLAPKIRKIRIAEDKDGYGVYFSISKEYDDLINKMKSSYIEYSMSKKFEIIYVYKGHK